MKSIKEKKKILLADDDADDRILFEQFFQHRNDIILLPSVVNGAAVIERLDDTVHDADLPDLIILDQNMPLMNGKQTLSFLKCSERYSQIPVCICSTYADNQLIEDCLKIGAYKVTTKPITDKEYQSMMNDFLSVFSTSMDF